MKITRIAVISLLGILLVSGVACCPTPTGTNVYSKFGFSFEYPPGVTLTEEGLYAATADANSGIVSWEVGDDFFGIVWAKMEIWGSEMAELNIDAEILGFEMMGAVVELIGDKVTLEMSGFDVMYQLFEITMEGEEYNGIVGVWYCEPGTRAFNVDFFIAGAPLPYLEDFMSTFSCQ